MLKVEWIKKSGLSTSQFHTLLKNASLPIKDSYSSEEDSKIEATLLAASSSASSSASANASNPTSGGASATSGAASSFKFDGLNRELLQHLDQQQGAIAHQRTQAAQLQGMLENIQLLAGRIAGKEKLEAMLLGLTEPENEAEVQILAIAREMQSYMEPSLPPFVTIQEDGTFIVNLAEALPKFNPNALIGATNLRQIEAAQ